MFQVAFHHFFQCGLKDIAHHVGVKGFYSLEFEQEGLFNYLSVRFWKDQTLVRVRLCRFGFGNEFPKGHFGVISRLMSVFSQRPDIVSCSGCCYSILQTLDESPLTARGIQFPLRFDVFDLRGLLHKPTMSVFGHIDFFSVLQYLVIFMGGARGRPWMLTAPELMQVRPVSSTL